MAKAGYCSGCGTNVWLDESGGCVAGHGPECVSGAYEVGAPASAKKKKGSVWLVVLAVLVPLSLLVCGILSAIAVPVFNGAKVDAQKRACFANERMVEGGAEVYVADKGSNQAADWDALMAELYPGILQTVPVCPNGGTYTWVPSKTITAGGSVQCSVHGNYSEEPTP